MLLNFVVEEDSWESLGLQRSNQSILKEISPEYSLEGLMLKLKLQYFGHLMWRNESLEKTLMLGKKGITENEMVGWHHQLDGHESEQAPGLGLGQGSLACCIPWGCKESDITEWLNWTSSKEQASFNFMAAVTICSDFGDQENKVCLCFHCFPIYLPWSDVTRCHDLSFLNAEF